MRTMSNETVANLQIRLNPVTGEPEVYCFATLMQDFLDVSIYANPKSLLPAIQV